MNRPIHSGHTSDRPQPPLRVLFADSQSELGGAGFALLTMLQHLDRNVITPTYVSFSPQRSEIQSQVEALGIPTHHIPAGRFRHLLRAARAVVATKKLIRKENIDLVMTNSGHPLLFARAAARWADKPCVWWVHGYVPAAVSSGGLIDRVLRLIGADAFLANSEYTAAVLRQDFSPNARIQVARPGVDLGKFCPNPQSGAQIRSELGIGSGERLVGIFGRLQRWKGQHIFLQAAEILSSGDAKARFLIAGSSMFGIEPEYAEELKQFAERPSLRGRVLFVGNRANPQEMMNACDLIVHASIEPEPWGLVVAEGMAVGRAVIAAAAGGPLEMITDRQDGLLVAPGDSKALAHAMEELLNRCDWRTEIGAAARLHAVREYDPERAAALLCKELQRISSNYARTPLRVTQRHRASET
ncbi:MAG: glycosyltransferase family 4 protein [Acidipila sp.]|nr:glycosyltransferase family 4 protein [Acidipila sp.]